MTIDSLLSATIVTADGRIIRDCSESNEPDLLFAIRGAGANFGCVTEFVFKLHPITTTVYGGILYPAEEKDMARNLEVCRGYKAHMDTAPNEVSSVLSFAYSPPPKIKPMLSVIPIYNGNGTKEEAFELLRPIREMESRGFNVGPHMLSVLHRRKYSQLQSSLDAGSPAGTCWYGKNVFVDRLDDAIFEHLLKTFREIPVSTCSIAVLPTGGKVGERKVHETAYPHRTSKYWIFVWCVYTEPSLKPAIRTWGNKVIAGCAHAKVGAFANQYEQASEGYEVWGANRERLLELKRKWDPDNVFSATISLGGSGEKAAL